MRVDGIEIRERGRGGKVVSLDLVGEDGTATVYAMMPSALQLFADGTLPRAGAEPVEVVIGGGDADEFAPLLPEPCSKLEHLVLRGLAVVASCGEA